jgi:hypothetical protein
MLALVIFSRELMDIPLFLSLEALMMGMEGDEELKNGKGSENIL